MSTYSTINGFFMKKALYIILFALPIYSQNTENENSLENKMNNYKEKVKVKWKYNPLRIYETDRYFSPWLDPDNYNTSFWFGDILNANHLYQNKNFNLDNVVMYFSPKLAVDLAPIAFNINEDKHRFRIGVGYYLKLFFSSYKKGKISFMEQHFYMVIICKWKHILNIYLIIN